MSYPAINGISSDVVRRIFDVAEELFLESGGNSMPTVDAVRRKAGADMNATSQTMKEWRKLKLAQPTPIEIHVPNPIKTASEQFLGLLWGQAKEMADESLKAAQNAWNAEKEELAQMQLELVSAFEAIEAEKNALETQLNMLRASVADLEKKLSDANQKLTVEAHRADVAESRLDELHQQVSNYVSQLAERNEVISELRNDNQELQRMHYAELDRLNAVLGEAKQGLNVAVAKLEAQQAAQAQQKEYFDTELARMKEDARALQIELSESRKRVEQLAGEQGRREALEEQNKQLLQALSQVNSSKLTKSKTTKGGNDEH